MDTSAVAYDHEGQPVKIGSRTGSSRGQGAICVRSGGWVHPLAPDPATLNIDDIAHALSMICRYTGHVSEFWSVAAHSIEVSKRVEAWLNESPAQIAPWWIKKCALTALLHDASEAYLVDVPRGLKPLFTGYKENEARLEECLAKKFDLFYPFPNVIKTFDDAILIDEIANFFVPHSGLWDFYQIGNRPKAPRLISLSPKFGRDLFLRRFEELTR